jgi:hypothetical protein
MLHLIYVMNRKSSCNGLIFLCGNNIG